jgi:hypothetical protein
MNEWCQYRNPKTHQPVETRGISFASFANKKFILLAFLFIGAVSFLPAADQIFFELNGGIWFYPGIGGKVGWIHHWNNEKIGLIADVSYYNNGFTDEGEGWMENIREAHNVGLAAGVVFNNMGFSGLLRTSEYIKLKGVLSLGDRPSFAPGLDIGFKLNLFLHEKTALSVGIGLDMVYFAPFPYFSLGMTFTL